MTQHVLVKEGRHRVSLAERTVVRARPCRKHQHEAVAGISRSNRVRYRVRVRGGRHHSVPAESAEVGARPRLKDQCGAAPKGAILTQHMSDRRDTRGIMNCESTVIDTDLAADDTALEGGEQSTQRSSARRDRHESARGSTAPAVAVQESGSRWQLKRVWVLPLMLLTLKSKGRGLRGAMGKR